ncbi:nitroreductase family protein [Trichomonas vaginalis G3]|uniref:Nitroreductase family protein n=1 Tax=Trichomonas vaginalis (strain ATCC PRA-98 / G3) TaxID=412133 RepID=A2ESW6_TRIV3|nr:nitroreductase family protein [Trichomonas vaginalis G3]EAY04224.1 nitroreductase family protein [Trichomonas vaginalis G3]KAI5550036.1 nitroreductase family protein [Trichomonas vaginalis G3]|eukprot:XP_001316447.1 nitroreductase family protein [Trichomonas vaginalis G3]
MFDAIKERRAVRSYITEEKIPKDVLENIIKAAQNAPTGCDFQSYDFIVDTNREHLTKIAHAVYNSFPGIDKFLKNPDIFYGAPCVIFIVPARPFREDCCVYDMGIIGQSICLEAKVQGYASVQIGFVHGTKPEVLKPFLDLPRDLSPLAVAIGKPSPDFTPAPKEITSKIH